MEENYDPLARRVPSFAQGKRILLVDRDASSLTCIASVLESYSYNVTSIELESVAMSIFLERKDEFDAVMVDMNMKDMTSLEFVRGVLLAKSYTPIILMSSTGDEGSVSKALADGACHFLEKPIPDGQLQQIWQHVHRMRKLKLSEDREDSNGSGVSMSEGGAPIEKENGDGDGDGGSRCRRREIDHDQEGKKKGGVLMDPELPIGRLTMGGIDDEFMRVAANDQIRRGWRKRSAGAIAAIDNSNGLSRNRNAITMMMINSSSSSSSFTHGRDLVSETNPFAYALNTNHHLPRPHLPLQPFDGSHLYQTF